VGIVAVSSSLKRVGLCTTRLALVVANAPNEENAVKLMEFLASPEAQRIYAEANGEYPVVDGVPASALVQSWGPLKADPLPLSKIAALRKQASELIDRVQFDQGPTN